MPLSHVTEVCLGYVVSVGQETLVSITDTGYIPHNIESYLVNADYYLFESNHDTEMLMNSIRPQYLKYRIVSDNGHMNNEYASKRLVKYIGDKTKEIVLAHISQECNTREKALSVLKETMEENGLEPSDYKLFAAKQNEIYYGGN